METFYNSPPAMITQSVFFATIIAAFVLHPFIYFIHQRDPKEKLPTYWKPLIYSSFALLNLGQLVFISSTYNMQLQHNSEIILTADKTKSILAAIGETNMVLILDLVEKKLFEMDTSMGYSDQEFFLFEESIVQIVFSGRNFADLLNLKLPNGEYLGEAMMKVYTEKELREEIKLITQKVLKQNYPKSYKLVTVKRIIKKRQFELVQKIMRRCFL